MKTLKFILLSIFLITTITCKAQNLNPRLQSIKIDSLRAALLSGRIYFTNNRGSQGWVRTQGDSLFLGDITGEISLGALLTGIGEVTIAGTPIAGQFATWFDNNTIQGTNTVEIGTDDLQLKNTGTSNTIRIYKFGGVVDENEAHTTHGNSATGLRITNHIKQNDIESDAYLDSAGFHVTKQFYIKDTTLLDYIDAHVQAGTGDVDVSGTPTSNMLTAFTDANTIQGVDFIKISNSRDSIGIVGKLTIDQGGISGPLMQILSTGSNLSIQAQNSTGNVIQSTAAGGNAYIGYSTTGVSYSGVTESGIGVQSIIGNNSSAFGLKILNQGSNLFTVKRDSSTFANKIEAKAGGRFYGTTNGVSTLYSSAAGTTANAVFGYNTTGRSIYGYTETGVNLFTATTGIANHCYTSGAGTSLFLESGDSTAVLIRVYDKRQIFRMSQDSSVFFNYVYIKSQAMKSDTSVCYITPTGKVLIGDSIGAGFGLTMPLPTISEYLADTLNGEIAWYYKDAAGNIVKTYGIANQFYAMEQLQAASEIDKRYIKQLNDKINFLIMIFSFFIIVLFIFVVYLMAKKNNDV